MQQSFFKSHTALFDHFCSGYAYCCLFGSKFGNELSIWSASISVSLHWLHQHWSKSSKKNGMISYCFISIVNLGSWSKTPFMWQKTLNQTNFSKTSSESILYFYKQFQPHYESLITFIGMYPRRDINRNSSATWLGHSRLNWLESASDYWRFVSKSGEDAAFFNSIVPGRHRKIHLMKFGHNFSQPAKNSKQIGFK